MPKPRIYYEDESVTLWHGDSREVAASLPDASFDAVITDPPYTERTHSKAKSNKQADTDLRAIDFDAFTDADLAHALTECGRLTKRWVVTNLDYRHAFQIDAEPLLGLRVMRIGVWVKTNPMPQITADRPGTGWEAIAYLHRDDVKPSWNGGGKHGNFVLPTVQNEGHPTSKPLSMVSEWVRRFTDPGDVIFDPFAGSGTTLRAALDNGRKAVGVERDERYCKVIAKRLSQGAFDLFAA